MPYGIVLEFAGVTKQQYDAVNEKLGIDPATGTGDWPKGLTSHVGGTTPSGLCVVEVWESKADQEAFMSGRLGPAIGEIGLPAPERVTELEIIGYATP
jgi:hypothetical protein